MRGILTATIFAGALLGLAGCNQSGFTRSDLTSVPFSKKDNTHTVRGDRGGLIVSYAMRVDRHREAGTKVRFAGKCDSACTLFLSLPPSQTCIVKGATFGFHKPYGSSRSGNLKAANFMMNQYPGWVRAWIKSRGGLKSSLQRMDYSYARRYLRTCDSKSPSGWH